MSVLFLYAHQKQRANIWVSTEQMEWLMNGTNGIDSMRVIHIVWNEANQKAEQIRFICKIMCFAWVRRHVITENTVFSKVQHLKPEKGYRFFLLVHFFPPLYFLFFIVILDLFHAFSLWVCKPTSNKIEHEKLFVFLFCFHILFHQPKLLFVAREKDRSEINLCKMSALMNCLGNQKFGKIVQKYGFIINSI